MSDTNDPTWAYEKAERISIMIIEGRVSEQDAIDYVELAEMECKAKEVQNG